MNKTFFTRKFIDFSDLLYTVKITYDVIFLSALRSENGRYSKMFARGLLKVEGELKIFTF